MGSCWKSINELRETTIDISGGFYSEKYVKKHNLSEKSMAQWFGENPSMWIPEPIEVSVNDKSEILYCTKKVGSWYEKQKEIFETSLGTFISHNHGEFGGELITPKENLYGNFVEVFECNNIVYAIDSCNHMCMGHIKIYAFSKKLKAIKLYESIDFWENDKIYQSLSFKGLCVKEDRSYILSAGRVEHDYMSDNKIIEEKSFLYEIKDRKIINTIEFDYLFSEVENICVDNNLLIIGMDKVVAIADLETKEIKAYTPIGIEAEKDIIKTKANK